MAAQGKSVKVTTVVPRADVVALGKLAARNDRSLAAEVRTAIRERLQRENGGR